MALHVFEYRLARAAENAPGGVVVYEASGSFPDEEGWEWTPFCDPVRELAGGWLTQVVEVGCEGPPGGDQDRYVLPLGNWAGSVSFFFEWRMRTDGSSSEMVGVAPASFVTADLFGVSYHFTMAANAARLIRDNFLPIILTPVQATLPHVYRLELRSQESYTWYVDGSLVDAGVPEGQYPTETAVLAWAARVWYEDSVSMWSYIRLGVIPEDASGDYDSDAAVTLTDHYFVTDCLTKDGPGIFGGPEQDAGPGCRFADFDADSDVDLLDFAEFQNGFGG